MATYVRNNNQHTLPGPEFNTRHYCHFCLRVLTSAILVLSMLVNKKYVGEVTFNGM
jgi:hypothetical protein